MRIKKISGILLLSFFMILSSCFKEEDMINPPVAGDVETSSVVLGVDYENQIYYNLYGNQVKSSNSVTDWDLAFECKSGGYHIILNSAKMMYAGNSSDTNFNKIISSQGLNMIFDKSDGDIDSTAIGEWYFFNDDNYYSHNYVYVVNRGNDENQQSMGEKKISIDIVDSWYQLRYANLDGSNESTVLIKKDDLYNYVYFSFDTGELRIAPPKDEWSLMFSRYSTLLISNGEQYPYLVTGVLLNPNSVKVAMDTTDFFALSLKDTINYDYSKKLDFIGYDWKYYNFDDGIYTIVPNKNFIIKNNNGFFYKLRFIGFYDEFGVKGTITFESAEL